MRPHETAKPPQPSRSSGPTYQRRAPPCCARCHRLRATTALLRVGAGDDAPRGKASHVTLGAGCGRSWNKSGTSAPPLRAVNGETFPPAEAAGRRSTAGERRPFLARKGLVRCFRRVSYLPNHYLRWQEGPCHQLRSRLARLRAASARRL